MAGGNTVELKFAGDARSLNRTFDDVGKHSKDMAEDVGRSGRDVKGSIETMADGADRGEQRIIGLRDAFTGTGDVMQGFASGNIVQVLTGFADLASSVANFAGPVIAKLLEKIGLVTIATEAETGAQVGLNTAMSLNPIGIVVIALAALAAGFFIAYQKSETFRNAVNTGLGEMRDLAVGVWGWISDHWPLLLVVLTGPFGLAFLAITKWRDDIIGLIESIPRRIADFGGVIFSAAKSLGKHLFDGFISGISGVGEAIGEGVVGGLKSVVNAVIEKINAIQVHVHFDTHIPGVGNVGFDWGGLGIPRLHAGGVVPGVVGTEVPTILQAGERVSSIGSGSGPMVVNVYALDPRSAATAVVRAIDEYEQANGRRYARAS